MLNDRTGVLYFKILLLYFETFNSPNLAVIKYPINLP